MNRLGGKVAVVTGGGYGNGRAIALRFAEEGAAVVLGDIDEERMAETAELVCARGGQAEAVRCDVARKRDIEHLIRRAVDSFGRIDIAVANAGIVEQDTDCLRMAEEQWDRVLAVNLKGVFFTLQTAANQMIAQGGGGRLIALASIMAEWGAPITPAYCASKGGVKQLVKCFAMACGRFGITCNAIAPGFIDTAMTRMITENPVMVSYLLDRTPAGRIGQPSDVAHVAAFLASEEAAFLTGTVIYPDGGITAGLYSAAAAAVFSGTTQPERA